MLSSKVHRYEVMKIAVQTLGLNGYNSTLQLYIKCSMSWIFVITTGLIVTHNGFSAIPSKALWINVACSIMM